MQGRTTPLRFVPPPSLHPPLSFLETFLPISKGDPGRESPQGQDECRIVWLIFYCIGTLDPTPARARWRLMGSNDGSVRCATESLVQSSSLGLTRWNKIPLALAFGSILVVAFTSYTNSRVGMFLHQIKMSSPEGPCLFNSVTKVGFDRNTLARNYGINACRPPCLHLFRSSLR